MRHMATKKYSLILFSSLGVAAVATLLVFRLISASTTRNQIPTLAVVVAAVGSLALIFFPINSKRIIYLS